MMSRFFLSVVWCMILMMGCLRTNHEASDLESSGSDQDSLKSGNQQPVQKSQTMMNADRILGLLDQQRIQETSFVLGLRNEKIIQSSWELRDNRVFFTSGLLRGFYDRNFQSTLFGLQMDGIGLYGPFDYGSSVLLHIRNTVSTQNDYRLIKRIGTGLVSPSLKMKPLFSSLGSTHLVGVSPNPSPNKPYQELFVYHNGQESLVYPSDFDTIHFDGSRVFIQRSRGNNNSTEIILYDVINNIVQGSLVITGGASSYTPFLFDTQWVYRGSSDIVPSGPTASGFIFDHVYARHIPTKTVITIQ